MGFAEAILFSVMTAATPLVLAAIGELVVERSGVLNLGVEGMMIMGAVVAFAAAQLSGSAFVGALCGLLAGAAFSLLFGFLTLTLVANQVATGLALTRTAATMHGSLPRTLQEWLVPRCTRTSPARSSFSPASITA